MGLQCSSRNDVEHRKLPDRCLSAPEWRKTYRDYLTMMLAEPNVNTVLTWGITDVTRAERLAHASAAGRQTGAPLALRLRLQSDAGILRRTDAIDSRRRAQPGGDPYAPFKPGRQSAQPVRVNARACSATLTRNLAGPWFV